MNSSDKEDKCLTATTGNTTNTISHSANNQPLTFSGCESNNCNGVDVMLLNSKKSKLKLSTSLANQRANALIPVSMPQIPTTSPLPATTVSTFLCNEQPSTKKGPLDLTVINGHSTSDKNSLSSANDGHYQSRSTVQVRSIFLCNVVKISS